MNYMLFFWVSIGCISCSELAIEIVRPRINRIMKTVNPKYSGRSNNYRDGIRVLRAYRSNMVVVPNEKKMLLFHLIMNLISHISLITLILILLSGPGFMEMLNK